MLRESLFFTFLLILMCLYSCQTIENKDYVDCRTVPPKKATLHLSFGNKTTTTSTNYWYADEATYKDNKDYPSFYIAIPQESEASLTHALEVFGSKINLDKEAKVYGLVLYCNKNIEKQTIIDEQDVKGIGLYVIKKEYIYHQLFIKEGTSFKYLPKYTKTVRGMGFRDTDRFLNEVIIQAIVRQKL